MGISGPVAQERVLGKALGELLALEAVRVNETSQTVFVESKEKSGRITYGGN